LILAEAGAQGSLPADVPFTRGGKRTLLVRWEGQWSVQRHGKRPFWHGRHRHRLLLLLLLLLLFLLLLSPESVREGNQPNNTYTNLWQTASALSRGGTLLTPNFLLWSVGCTLSCLTPTALALHASKHFNTRRSAERYMAKAAHSGSLRQMIKCISAASSFPSSTSNHSCLDARTRALPLAIHASTALGTGKRGPHVLNLQTLSLPSMSLS